VAVVARPRRAPPAGTESLTEGAEAPLSPGDRLEQFERSYGFTFDVFQRRACSALARGSSALVAAPTGAGKTVVGEFAAWLALQAGGRAFYTTPIKALSNQKYADFSALHGPSAVGLLTGDNSINGDAPIVVMTTEVLRNMIYEDARDLEDLHYVVLDEVHYLQDRYRGAVWEEVLIHLPVEVQTVSLSATVSNAEEFGEWLQTLRGDVDVIIEEQRPVEIRHWYLASDELLPMFVQRPERGGLGRTAEQKRGGLGRTAEQDGDVIPNPRGREFDRRRRRGSHRPERGGRRTREKRARIPLRVEVVERMADEGMLPAIYFIFSRRGCSEAVARCLQSNVRLTTPAERDVIVEVATEHTADLTHEELDVLGFAEWIEGLRRGVAAHHAGMIPPFKETTEELFKQGLVKVVFATETLALGINMPARTVVIESLTKFTGESHELMTPGEYTQLSGRAGRRGIDELGHSVVLLQRFTPFDVITRLASTRTYPLQSSFQPSYNMAVNLVRNYEREEAEHLVNSSFAQYQVDRDVVQLEQTRERLEAYHASYVERSRCERGDLSAYASLSEELRRLEQSGAREQASMEAATPRRGDVFELTGGRRKGRYAVVDVIERGPGRAPRVLAVSAERVLVRFGAAELRARSTIGRVRLTAGFDPHSSSLRRRVALEIAGMTRPRAHQGRRDGARRLRDVRKRLERHPCHDCPDLGRHLHFHRRATRLSREIAGIDRRIRGRTGTLARRFQHVLEVLEHFGYVEEWRLAAKGEALARVYNEADLLVMEGLEQGIFDALDASGLAAVLSTVVYEARGPEVQAPGHLPTVGSAQAWRDLVALRDGIRKQEETRALDLTREPDPGFAERAYLWASGASLDEVLGPDDAPGDFVRTMKQLVDLLRQIEVVADGSPLAGTVRDAIKRVHRGVVAYSSLES
jgi:ATP-dependent RNA helicase HelY